MPFTAIVHMCELVSIISFVLINTREIPTKEFVYPSFENQTAYSEENGDRYIQDPTVYSKEDDKFMPNIYFKTATRTLIVIRKHGDMLQSCELIDHMNSDLNSNETSKVLDIDEQQLDILVSRCDMIQNFLSKENNSLSTMHTSYQKQHNSSKTSETSEERQKRWVYYPGTLWCGPGNDAGDNVTNFGEEEDTDICCMNHDYCERFINVGETKYGLSRNLALWAKFECTTCNRDFYNCLKNINSTTANAVGEWFFDSIDIGCFDFPLKCDTEWEIDEGWVWSTKKCRSNIERDNSTETDHVLSYHSNPFVYKLTNDDN